MPIRPAPLAAKASEAPKDPQPLKTKEYSTNYKEECFFAWYQAGRPRGRAAIDIIPVDEDGRKPHFNVFLDWKRDGGWNDRADRLDLEAQRRIEELAVEAKVQMFKRHAEIGSGMQEVGWNYLVEHGPESSATAARLIKEGAELERVSTGGAQALSKFADMSDLALKKLIRQLMSGVEEEVPEEEVIDAEVDTV